MEFPTCILRALIRVEQHALRPTTLLMSHLQHLHEQVGIGACRERPANHPTREQVEYDGRI